MLEAVILGEMLKKLAQVSHQILMQVHVSSCTKLHRMALLSTCNTRYHGQYSYHVLVICVAGLLNVITQIISLVFAHCSSETQDWQSSPQGTYPIFM